MFLGLVLALNIVLAENTHFLESYGPVVVNQALPTFGGHTIDDNYLSYKSLLNSHDLIVISYFTTSCGPCKKNLPIIDGFADKNDKVTAVYINVGEDAVSVRRFLQGLPLKHPIILDKFQSIAARHGVFEEGREPPIKVPITFILNKEGKVLKIIDIEGDDFETQLNALAP